MTLDEFIGVLRPVVDAVAPSDFDGLGTGESVVRQKGNGGYTSLCPAHNDHRASLSIDAGKGGRILLNCHAGCSAKDICEALGLTLEDLAPTRGLPKLAPADVSALRGGKPAPRGRGRIVKTYDYVSESGELLFQVCRMEPKDFRQRRPDGKGGWSWSIAGVRRVLYRLPEVRAAAQAGGRIFVVEGEKDADNLGALGLVATSLSGGSTAKWLPDYTEALRGACAVVVIADKDGPGRAHAGKVARAVSAVAPVKVLELPGDQVKDASDWLEAGGTTSALEQIVNDTAPWRAEDAAPEVGPALRPVLTCLADVKPEAVRFLWEPYIPLGKLTLLEGDPAAAKTYMALWLAARISKGEPFPNNPTPREPASVLYMTAEDGIADTLRVRLDTLGADPARVHALEGAVDADGVLQPLTLADLDTLDAALRTIKPKPVLMVVDPLQGFLGAGVDMHRANEVRPILSGLVGLAEQHGVAMLGIRHLSKAPASRAHYRGMGSIDFTAAARSVLLAGKEPTGKTRAMAHLKSSCTAHGPTLEYEVGGPGGFRFVEGASSLTAQDLVAAEKDGDERGAREEARDFLLKVLAGGPQEASDVRRMAKSAGITESTLKRAKTDLGILASDARAGGGKIGAWRWALPADHQELTGPRAQVEPLASGLVNPDAVET